MALVLLTNYKPISRLLKKTKKNYNLYLYTKEIFIALSHFKLKLKSIDDNFWNLMFYVITCPAIPTISSISTGLTR